jgi:RNA polymerase sigma-70 factor (ECF subfamily)
VKQARRKRLLHRALAAEATSVNDQIPDIDLARAIGALPARQRAAVALFYLEDLALDDVADVLQVSPSTVKQHLHRARARLAKILAEDKEEVSGDVS